MLRENLTIIIPHKNERAILFQTLAHLQEQKSIIGTKVIIADISDDLDSYFYINMLKVEGRKLFPLLDIIITEGGYPADARHKGAILLENMPDKTKYILFLDADMYLKDNSLLENMIVKNYGRFDLMTATYTTDKGYNRYYRIFDVFQWFTAYIMRDPFAIGGFQLFDRRAYWKIGGYDPTHLVGEDYMLCKKVDASRFYVYRTKGCYTSARRLQNKGVGYMFKLMMKSWWNRNNPAFFQNDQDYWN